MQLSALPLLPTLHLWSKALRVHQWAKNLLLFVPLLTSFGFLDPVRLRAAVLAFAAFSLAASGSYLVNDVRDVKHDRAHPRKRNRPLASGRLSIASGLGAAAGLTAAGLALALLVSSRFAAVLCLYLIITAAYSWRLKRHVLVDVLVLALLYTLRVFAGSVAVHTPVSSWLLAFSVFLFFSLALVKRCSELVSVREAGGTSAHGRDYRVADLAILWPLGVGSSLCAVVVFGMFISSPATAARYASPDLLWLSALSLLYWVARLWIKTGRGQMHDDPIVFALKDAGSALSVCGMLAAMLLAHFAAL